MPDECFQILIVDDDKSDRLATREALLASGLPVEVTEAESCAATIEALSRDECDGVLLDYQLADGTGLDVLGKAQALGIKTPIIILTGYGDELVAVQLIKAGAADYLSKSRLTPEGLGRALQNAVRFRRAEEQTETADAARRKSEAQFRSVAASNIIGIMFWDLSGAVTDANDAFLEMIGYTRDDLQAGAINWKAMTPPEWMDEVHARVAELKAQGTCALFEKEYLRKDGGRVAVLISASMLEGAAGQGLAFVVDVTERRRTEVAQQFLAEAGEILSSSLNYFETLANVAGLTVPQLADWCAVDLLGEDGVIRRVSIAHADPEKANLARESDRRFGTDPHAPNGPASVLRTGQPEWMPEIPDALLAAYAQSQEHLQMLREGGLRSYLCVPLMARGRALGAITLVTAESGRRYSEADLELAQELARRAALAVDNARLYFETKARAEREAVVNALGQALRVTMDADEILEVATREVGELLGVSRCGWYWLDAEQEALQVAAQQWVGPGSKSFSGIYPLSIWGPEMVSRWMAGEPISVADCAQDPKVTAYRVGFLEPLGIKAFICCPVFLRGAWAGLFVVHQTDAPRDWTRDEILLLRQVADMLAPTLDNARLYAREHRVADMLQAALLSNVPDSLSSLDLSTVYRPGLDESKVGGDFYDAFQFADGRLALVMGDVSGKGLSAAVLTATAKFSLRAFAAEVAAPGLVMTRLNRTLRSESSGLGDHFVTLFYAVFDPASGRLAYASAGHETQIIKRIGGGITPLTSTGPILGIAEHRFEQKLEHLAPGDSLILYTDGLTEARSAETRELLDLSRITGLIDRVRDEVGAGGLAAYLEQTVLDWTAGHPQDDLALLVARRQHPNDMDRGPADGTKPGGSTLVIQEEIASAADGELLFRFAFPSRPDYAAEVRQAVAHWMSTLGFRRNEVEDFQTAITEAVTNAVRHGSPQGEGDQFHVSAYRVLDVSLVVDVSDCGPGLRDLEQIPVMPEPEAMGGRGLPLMQELADAVQYAPSAKGMRVRLIKKRAPGAK